MLGTLWLIPILPLAGFLVTILLGAAGARKGPVTAVGVGSVGADHFLVAGFSGFNDGGLQPAVGRGGYRFSRPVGGADGG